MHHHIYTTEGIVVAVFPEGEANLVAHIFTRDMGLLKTHAQGVRRLQSKLKHALIPYTRATVALVRGKRVWRLVGAASKDNIYRMYESEPRKFAVSANILGLLRRLLPGEEGNPDLFDTVASGLLFLKDVQKDEDIIRLECLLNTRILHLLGYGGTGDDVRPHAEGSGWSIDGLESFAPHMKGAVLHINKALRASHLI